MPFKKKHHEGEETPRMYYERVVQGKLKHDELYESIPVDGVIYFSEHHRCTRCGSPKMVDSVDVYECNRCLLNRVGEVEFKHRQSLMDHKPVRLKEAVVALANKMKTT